MRVPFGRGAARKGDQVRFLLAVQLALLARPRSVIDGGLPLIRTWRMTWLRRLTPTICAFHLGFSLVCHFENAVRHSWQSRSGSVQPMLKLHCYVHEIATLRSQ